MPQPFEQFELTRTGVGATIEDHPLGGPVLRLTSTGGTAEIALQGAQLLAWHPNGQAPVIWLSPTERLANPPASPKPVRGGTPVCWPWFAAHPTDPAKPMHGFVRTQKWQVDRVERTDGAVRAELNISTKAADQPLWPHQASLTFTATLSDTLKLELTTHNTGTDAFALTQALHTYFAVSDISAVAVEGFDGQTYADKLDGFARKPQSGDIIFAGEVDRVYDEHSGVAVIVDRGFKRRIEITKSGSGSSVVWNPGSERCARMGDLGPDGYRTMVCVETANAGRDVITILSGGRYTLMASYRVLPL